MSFRFSLLGVVVTACAFSNISFAQDLGDAMPWLKQNHNVGAIQNYNVTGPLNPDGTRKIDPVLPAFTDEMRYLNEPSNNLPFLVDRTLDRNYIEKQYAILKVLDKVTAKISTVKARVDTPIKFGWIEITAKLAKKTPPEEEPEATAFIEVTAEKFKKNAREEVFSGFIFASSPSISGLEHPRYDIRLFDCLNEDEINPKKADAKKEEAEQANNNSVGKAQGGESPTETPQKN